MRGYKLGVSSIFDLKEDDTGMLRMPFNPIDYGVHNTILRKCHRCGKEFEQGQMKELGVSEDYERAIASDDKWYAYSIFFDEACWKVSEYSDAGKWEA